MPGLPDRIASLSPEKQALLRRRLEHQNIAADDVSPSGQRIDINRVAPAPDNRQRLLPSFAQQRLWFLDRLTPDNPAYNICQAMRLRGPLDLEALRRALNAILTRHESLRTRFASEDGNPVQVIARHWDLEVPVVDLSSVSADERDLELERRSRAEAHRPFDLSQDLMLRVRILRLASTEHVVLIVMHHIASDGWSHGVFLRELAALYEDFAAGRAPRLASPIIQYADFAYWQREWLQGERLKRQLSYWQAQLRDSPGRVALPTDRPRPEMQTFCGARCSTTIAPELLSTLRQLALDENVTLFIVLLAAFKVLLLHYSGQTDISLGSGHANRNRVEVEPLIGYFVNTLVLRTDLSGSPTFRDLLARVSNVCFGAHENQDLPFEQLVAELDLERDLSHSPLFNIAFTLHNTPAPDFGLSGLDVTLEKVPTATAKFDLSVFFDDTDNGFTCTAEYNTALFDECTISCLLEHYRVLLESSVRNPDRSITDLPLLSETDRQHLTLDWNRTDTAYPAAVGVLDLFESQVQRTPSSPAVACEGRCLTYHELNARAPSGWCSDYSH